jgi:hypothetical protein
MTDNRTESLLAEVNAFIERTGMSPSAFGTRAVNDVNFVFTLRGGRNPTFRRIQRARDFIASHQSESAA